VDEVEVRPEQPPEIVAAIAAIALPAAPEPDPWWLAGLQESLET